VCVIHVKDMSVRISQCAACEVSQQSLVNKPRHRISRSLIGVRKRISGVAI
jgi:hypothetical protein